MKRLFDEQGITERGSKAKGKLIGTIIEIVEPLLERGYSVTDVEVIANDAVKEVLSRHQQRAPKRDWVVPQASQLVRLSEHAPYVYQRGRLFEISREIKGEGVFAIWESENGVKTHWLTLGEYEIINPGDLAAIKRGDHVRLAGGQIKEIREILDNDEVKLNHIGFSTRAIMSEITLVSSQTKLI